MVKYIDIKPQNLIIANVLYKSEILESWGRGIKLMIDECRRVNLPDPEFHSDGSTVWVIFKYTRRAKLGNQEPDKNSTVTPQLLKVLNAIGDNMMSAKEIMQIFELKDKTSFLKTYLIPAINQGLIEPLYPNQPKHPRQKYRLSEKGQAWLKDNKKH